MDEWRAKEDLETAKRERSPPITLNVRMIDQIGRVFIEFSENLQPIDELEDFDVESISNSLFFNVTYETWLEDEDGDEEVESN